MTATLAAALRRRDAARDERQQSVQLISSAAMGNPDDPAINRRLGLSGPK
jgi:hypothetical protein